MWIFDINSLIIIILKNLSLHWLFYPIEYGEHLNQSAYHLKVSYNNDNNNNNKDDNHNKKNKNEIYTLIKLW